MRIHQLTVLRDAHQLQMVIEMPDLTRYLTSQVPNLPRDLFRTLPTLARHRCHNESGVSFRKECSCTEIPHLFEHIVLELQGQAQPVGVLRGETQWNWQETPRGYFSVCVEYDNELLVIAAVKLAERIVRSLDDHTIDTLDMPAELCRLREIARIGRELDEAVPAAPVSLPTWGFSHGTRVAPVQKTMHRRVRTTGETRRRSPISRSIAQRR